MHPRARLGVAALTLLTVASAQEAPAPRSNEFFPFVLPWNDAVRGTATDLSFLNAKPAGRNGWIVARDGHFVEEKTGRRLRFFGTNLGAAAAFPKKDDADAIAGRLAKLGINIVRFHHLQNDWDLPDGTIWKLDRMQIELDPNALDRLDYFISRLKAHGIYVNMNLQTTRKPVPENGLPETASQLQQFGKKADKYYERLIQLQEEYAKQLLDRRNPYTKLKYNEDPAIMVVEINNENSLVGWPGESPGAGVPGFPEPFRGDLVRQWNEWLEAQYGNDAALAQAWPTRDDRKAESVVTQGNAWTTENQSNGDVRFETVPNTGSPATAPDFVATVNSNPGPGWHVQAHLAGLTLENGQPYTVEFKAKADRVATFNVDARLDRPDWRFLGLGASVQVGPEWKTYTLSFVPSGAEPGHARVGLTLGDTRGRVEVKDLSIRPGLKVDGLQPGEKLGSIDLAPAGLGRRSTDYTRFLVETEARFSDRLRSYLRDKLGFTRANIMDTQISWGGLTSLEREKTMEFADNHAYWNHPTFLGSDWDPKNYRVDRVALVNTFPERAGTLEDLALFRVAGKPYSVSEYNHPAPNDYQAEMMPLYATFAAFQDWDVIYTFDWGATGTGRDNGRIDGYFDMAKNPAKVALFPAAALIFRQGLVPPAPGLAVLNLRAPYWEDYFTPGAAWQGLGQKPDVLTRRVAIRPQYTVAPTITANRAAPATTFRVSGEEGRRAVVSDTDRQFTATGFIGGSQFWNSEGVRVSVEPFGFDFGTVMITPTDDQPLARSKRILVSLMARAENTDMVWNTARTSVSDQWGKAPTLIEFVPAKITLPAPRGAKVWALDPAGKRKAEVSSTWANGKLEFSTSKQDATPWYEVGR